MSLFQCSKCGCVENTAWTNAGRTHLNNWRAGIACDERAIASAKARLGLSPDEPFGSYCSACTPFWYTPQGYYGIGPNPDPSPGCGLWHGEFPREFFPLGTMETGPDGNLYPKEGVKG